MWTIGITGHVAGGKSVISARLESAGCVRADADAYARESFSDAGILDDLMQRFGDAIFLPHGEVRKESSQGNPASSPETLPPESIASSATSNRSDLVVDRAALARIVFGNTAESKAALEDLNAIVHPWVRRRILDQLSQLRRQPTQDLISSDNSGQSEPIVVLDIPLLIESGWIFSCDEVWCVTADAAELRARAKARGWPDGEWQRRTDRQIPISRKESLSTRIFTNSGTLESLYQQIDRALTETRIKISQMRRDDHCW